MLTVTFKWLIGGIKLSFGKENFDSLEKENFDSFRDTVNFHGDKQLGITDIINS
jgi:hypothetical protein